MPKHTYSEAEKFVLSREFFGMKLGLENIRNFLQSIDNPQDKYKTIHISGTNGKGSTASMLASILRTQGYKTGLFTSPHLISLRERMNVNGKMIPQKSVAAFIDRHRQQLTKTKLSFFELITAMALDYFARAKVEIAVIETGLGGRLDASNVLKPVLTITTEISRDHLEILGKTLPKIAREKAGIIKKNVPHLIGMMPENAEVVFSKRCRQLKTPLYKLNKNNFKINSDSISFDYNSNGFSLKNIKPSLVGIHQLNNAALATKAVSILNKNKIRISKKALFSGLKNTRWPGRFQIVEYKRKPDHILDVSHNLAGIKAFVETFLLLYPHKKAHIITGFVKRKEHKKIFNNLSKIAASYALVPLNNKRSTDLNELIIQIDFKKVPYKKFGSLKTAYSKLMKSVSPDDIIIIIGSHFLVGEFMDKYNVK